MRPLPKWLVRDEGDPVTFTEPAATVTETSVEGATRRDRHAVKLNGHLIRQDGSVVRLAVVDLSYDGCGVECSVGLEPGESVKLFVVDRSGINAQVRWCSGSRVGLVFDTDARPTRDDQPRESERKLTAGQVTIRRRGGDRAYVRVFDASPQGCKVEIGADMDEVIWVRFEGLEPLEARVCWVDRSNAGVRFATPIHPAVFDLLLQRLGQRP